MMETQTVSKGMMDQNQRLQTLNVCYVDAIILLAAKLSNEHAALLLLDRAQSFFMEAFYFVSPDTPLGNKLSHMISIVAFAQGDITEAEKYWDSYNKSDLSAMRSCAAQLLMTSKEKEGLGVLMEYTDLVGVRFQTLLQDLDLLNFAITLSNETSTANEFNVSDLLDNETLTSDWNSIMPLRRYPSTVESERTLLSLLLSEAQGGIRTTIKLSDVQLAASELRPFDAKQRFRLGVSLAKLGLFDLAQRHVTLASTPWDPAHHRLRAILSFPHVHKSLRSLAQSVSFYEQQTELFILQSSRRSMSTYQNLCDSLDETSLVLDVLPLLHLVGYSAPRNDLVNSAPVALSVLLSEFYSCMCPTSYHQNSDDMPLPYVDNDKKRSPLDQMILLKLPNRKLRVGIVSGSFDGVSGRITVGMLDNVDKAIRSKIHLIAMCFPTPRDKTTDRANSLFDEHVNLFPKNRSNTVQKIRATKSDFILFADVATDVRSFALAHLRLAPFQGALWGWGGTTGISSIDFYFIPEMFWRASNCNFGADNKQWPQELFGEQVVLLSGTPKLSQNLRLNTSPRNPSESWAILQERFLFPPENRSHLYIFPGTVRDFHPEMDSAISILLKTDPIAMVVFLSPTSGRDQLPPLHPAVRHDLLHPAMPTAAVGILRRRLMMHMGSHALNRLRFLPPIDDDTYKLLLSFAVAVLDPFPVGVHMPIVEALIAGIPVVSAPSMQECTNSHVQGIADSLGLIGLDSESFSWPATPEEYAVFAMRLPRETYLRSLFTQKRRNPSTNSESTSLAVSHADQFFKFCFQLTGMNAKS